MTLRVDPAGLTAYAAQVTRARDDAIECRNYLGKYVKEYNWSDGGIFNALSIKHNAVVKAASEMADHLTTLLAASSDELTKVLAYYRRDDDESASELNAADARLPQVARPVPRRD